MTTVAVVVAVVTVVGLAVPSSEPGFGSVHMKKQPVIRLYRLISYIK